ncbi:MAG TPA: hypothetical protein VFS19_06865 [Planctomycetota bacterium]|nr:hypothetical protein [Planctomycetota bacterium]
MDQPQGGRKSAIKTHIFNFLAVVALVLSAIALIHGNHDHDYVSDYELSSVERRVEKLADGYEELAEAISRQRRAQILNDFPSEASGRRSKQSDLEGKIDTLESEVSSGKRKLRDLEMEVSSLRLRLRD